LATLAYQLAKYARSLSFSDLPSEIVQYAKNELLDTLGVALAAYDSDPARITRKVITALGGTPEATVIGSGDRLPAASAALINGVMVRYLDCNDTFLGARSFGHFSDVTSAALAVGERQQSTGRDVITALIIGYEIQAAFCNAASFRPTPIHAATHGAISSPFVAGHLLGLTEEQMANALGLAASCNVVLQTWLTTTGDMPMIKAFGYPWAAHGGVMAALLAQEGLTGPTTTLEFILKRFRIRVDGSIVPDKKNFAAKPRTLIKVYTAQAFTQVAIEGVLGLCKTHGIVPDDIESVVIHGCSEMVTGIQAGKGAYIPTTKEAADHSTPYVVAMALLEGDVTPLQFTNDRWKDPRVRAMVQRIRCVQDDEYERRFREKLWLSARMVITTKAGKVYAITLDNPKGHPLNPLTYEEIVGKFHRMASPCLSATQRRTVVELVNSLDSLPNLDPLMKALQLERSAG